MMRLVKLLLVMITSSSNILLTNAATTTTTFFLKPHQILRGGASASDPNNNPDAMMQDLLKNAGIDSSKMNEMLASMGIDDPSQLPSIEESMKQLQEMMASPIFQEYMSDPEKLEQSRQMILNNPMMAGMLKSMPEGFEEILNDKDKWRETMIQAAEMYKNMGSDLMNMMNNGMGGADFGNMDFGSAMGNTLLDELSEDD